MVQQPHDPACARRITEQGRIDGRTPDELVDVIHEHCGVSLLRAHRLAHGWTLAEAAERVRKQVPPDQGRTGAGLAHQRISQWEKGSDVPSPPYLEALCRVFRTRPDRLGIGHDYTPAVPLDDRREHDNDKPDNDLGDDKDEMKRRELLRMVASGGVGMVSAPMMHLLHTVRATTDRLLDTQSVSATTIDYWEEVVRDYGREQLTTPPQVFIARTVADFLDLRRTLERRQPLEFQRRLYRAMAQLAGLIAIEINDASEQREAYAWLHTARLAADEAGDRQLRAWISAKEATWYLWYDRPAQRSVDLAQAAQAIAGRAASTAGVLAAVVEARAQARLGRRPEALAALRRADAGFEHLAPADTEVTMLGIDVHRLHWNKGNALTTLGEIRAAMDAQRQACHLSSVDRSLVALDRSTCLIRAGELDHGCTLAQQVLLSLDPASRSGLPLYRARQIVNLVHPGDRQRTSARELSEVIADWRVLESNKPASLDLW